MLRRVALALAFCTVTAPAFAADEPKPAAPAAAAEKAPAATHDASGQVAVAAALRRSADPRVKAIAPATSGSEGTELAVATQSGELKESSGSLAAVHGSTASHAAAVAGTARDVRMDVPKAAAVVPARPAATPRALRRMNADRVIASLGPTFDRCAATATDAPRQPTSAVLRAVVSPGGSVEGAEVASANGAPPSVLSCATEALKSATFGAPGGAGATVLVPATFAAPHGS